jgi:ketosteroid isomerase-like protein
MSDRELELIRSAYEAGNRRDWDAMFAHFHPDAEWESDPRVPNAGVFRGRDEVRRFIEDQDAPFQSTVAEIERLIPSGDQVVALVKVTRRMRGSTAEMQVRIAHLWTLRDGKFARVQSFAERERALEAAGLPAAPA